MGSAGKGSALLIVLGIVSFLVVSALGFSIFMRTSRLPSSYLRRNITARHLVRAALAKAIGELEGDFNNNRSWGPERFYGIYDDPFPGVVLRVGADSESVRLLQQYLNVIAGAYPSIPTVNPTGYFGPRTEESVIAFQNQFGLEPTGTVGAITWAAIADVYEAISIGSGLRDGQYPGFEIGA